MPTYTANRRILARAPFTQGAASDVTQYKRRIAEALAVPTRYNAVKAPILQIFSRRLV